MDEEYKMGDAVLGKTTQEKDLGVIFSADMKVSEQCGIAASNGNKILGLIRRTITYYEKQLCVPLYKAIPRPRLEYCIQAWKPYRKNVKDIVGLSISQWLPCPLATWNLLFGMAIFVKFEFAQYFLSDSSNFSQCWPSGVPFSCCYQTAHPNCAHTMKVEFDDRLL